MNFEDLNKLKKIIESDLQITDENVMEKSLKTPHLFQKYLSYYIRESKILKQLELELEKMYGEKFKFLKEDGTYKLNQGEIEKYINSDEIYHKKSIEYHNQKLICTFLESTVQNFKTLSFSIKNYVDLKIFLSGGK